MRAKLRDDLMYVAVEGGVYLETGRAGTQLTGAAAHKLFQRLAPHLDGSVTVEQLTESLPPAQQRLVADMVGMLVQRGFARDLDSEPPHSLQEWEIARYQEAIAFAEHVADAPLHRFEGFRTGNLLLIGEGQAMATLLETLFRLGLRSVTVAHTGPDRQPLLRVYEQHRQDDPSAELTLAGSDSDLAGLIGASGAVLHCADDDQTARALALTRLAQDAQVPLLHAFPSGAEVWVGPTGGGCWECFTHHRATAGLPPGDATVLNGPISGLAGAALAFDYLRFRLGAESSGANRMTRIDLRSAETSQHLFGAHPDCGTCRPQASTAKEMAHRAPIDVETFAARMPALVDPRLGPVLDFGTAHHSQLMVSCVQTTVAGRRGGPVTVTAVGPTRKQALTRAAAAAVELLAACDPESAWCDWETGETRAVGPQRVVAATGFTWAEACGRALLKLCHPAGPPQSTEAHGWLERTQWPQSAQVTAADLALMGHELVAWHDSKLTAFVGTKDKWLSRSTATDPMTAVELAVQAASAVLTGRPHGGAEIGPDLGTADWATLLPTLLAKTGHRLAVRPADGLPVVRQVVPFLVEACLVPQRGDAA